MTKLTIIRGAAGTGKSTIACHLGGVARVNWFEADMYFDRNGHYDFDASRLGAAHRWCQESVMARLAYGDDVIVSNTTTTRSELNEYLKIAQDVGVEVRIIRTPLPWEISDMKERNTHRVPTKVLEKQVARYSPHTDEKEWEDMSIFGATNVEQ